MCDYSALIALMGLAFKSGTKEVIIKQLRTRFFNAYISIWFSVIFYSSKSVGNGKLILLIKNLILLIIKITVGFCDSWKGRFIKDFL